VFVVDGIESWKKLTKEGVEGACPLIGRSRLVSWTNLELHGTGTA